MIQHACSMVSKRCLSTYSRAKALLFQHRTIWSDVSLGKSLLHFRHHVKSWSPFFLKKSAVASVAIEPGIQGIGVGWMFTILTLILLLSNLSVLFVLKYGPRWRNKRACAAEEEAKANKEESAAAGQWRLDTSWPMYAPLLFLQSTLRYTFQQFILSSFSHMHNHVPSLILLSYILSTIFYQFSKPLFAWKVNCWKVFQPHYQHKFLTRDGNWYGTSTTSCSRCMSSSTECLTLSTCLCNLLQDSKP